MSKLNNTKEGFTSGYVMVNRRINSSHPIFKGDGRTLAIYIELVARMAYGPTTDNLGKTKNKVPLLKHQTLTSYRTLEKALGFPKHLIEPRIQKLIDGIPAYGDQAKVEGVIRKMPCQKMKGADGKKLSRNDGMVITIRSGAKFWRPPDTKPDDLNSSSSKTKVDGFVLPTELDTPEVREAWNDFKLHRKEKRKGLTGLSAKLVINKLVKAKLTPDEAAAELNKAIECGWTSVFPKEATVKVVKRSGKSSATSAGPESLVANDMKAVA